MPNKREEELINTCENDILEEIKSIIEKGGDINAQYDGWTPLTLASSSGYLNIVKFLVEKGADINAKSNCGWTALMWASMIGYFEIVKYLVENGADINAKNDYGWTALMLALNSKQSEEITNYLMEKKGTINFEKYNKKDSGTELILYNIMNWSIINSGNLKMIDTLMRNSADEYVKKFFKNINDKFNNEI